MRTESEIEAYKEGYRNGARLVIGKINILISRDSKPVKQIKSETNACLELFGIPRFTDEGARSDD